MVIVDSTVWVDFFNARTNPETLWLRRELLIQRIGLTDLILCEVLQGIRDDATFERVRRLLGTVSNLSTGGTALAVAASKHYRYLRARGITTRKTIDCLIATFCIEEGHSLLHRDRDFEPFERYLGLRIIHP